MPGLRIIALPPPRDLLHVSLIQTNVSRQLAGFTTDTISRMAKYPPQQPTPYVRTGDLGRNWKAKLSGARNGRVEVFNNVNRSSGKGRKRRFYAVYAQGPSASSDLNAGPGTRQTAVMKAKGWQNITDVANELWEKRIPGITIALRS